jgi:aminomethyltransferase
MKTTSLHQHHIDLHAKMVDFGGFDMPLFYSNITSEHLAVRQHVGMFDVSHMGEILITGLDALHFVNKLVSNTITDHNQKVTYALLCNHDGNIIDDLLVYVFDPQKILLVVNASNIEKDFTWIFSQKDHYQVELKNLSDEYSQIAIQGPLAHQTCTSIFDMSQVNLNFMEYAVIPFLDAYVILSRTGYTGEDGYEIYGKHNLIVSIWEKASSLGVTPCGLGCRDTLRFEASLPLYGHELSESINPVEAGLNFAVKTEDFIGSKKIHQSKDALSKKLVGIEMLEKGIPRADYLLFKDEKEIGYITTGYLLPTQNTGLALAYVTIDEAYLGNEIDVDIRNKKLKCKIVKKVFMKKNYKKGE